MLNDVQFAGTFRWPVIGSRASWRCNLANQWLFGALASLVAIVGCGPGVREITKISVNCPGQTSVDCDESVALPLMQLIATLPRIDDCLSMSRRGSVEMYVTWDGPQDSEALANELARSVNLLPSDVERPEFALFSGSTLPAPETGDEEVVSIRLDRERLAVLGLSASAVTQEVNSLASAGLGGTHSTLEELEATPVSEGQERILLRDVASVGLELHPKCVVRHNLIRRDLER